MSSATPLTAISGSSIFDYQKCKLRWCYRWISNRVPRTTPKALYVGKLIHEAFEDHFKYGTQLDVALDSLLADINTQYLSDKEAEAYRELRDLCEPLQYWKDEFDYKTLEVEMPFSFLLPTGITFRGRPDRVVKLNNKVFHMQTKSLDKGHPIGAFISIFG